MPLSPAFLALAQQSAVALRNIANEKDLLEWLEDLAVEKVGPADQRDEREKKLSGWLGSVGRRFMLKSGETSPFAPVEGERLPEWMSKAIASGAQLMSLSLTAQERDDFSTLLDWMRSEQGPAAIADWSKVSVAQAQASSEAWHKEQRDQAERIVAETEGLAGSLPVEGLAKLGELGQEWEGWSWVRLESEAALRQEGAKMRHCVGGYAPMVAKGLARIYSLRDPENKPRITVETREKSFIQVKSFANTLPGAELTAPIKALVLHIENDPALKGVLNLGFDCKNLDLGVIAPIGLALKGERGWELTPSQEVSLAEWMKTRSEKHKDWHFALLKACDMGFLQVIEKLAPKKRDPFFLGLEAAAENGHLDACKFLLPLSNPANDNHCALRKAASQGHVEVCELLASYADLKGDPEPLISAARGGRIDAFKLLAPLSAPLADIAQLSKAAGAGGNLDIVRLVIEDEAQASAALIAAAQAETLSPELASELIDKGASEVAAGEALTRSAKWAGRQALEALMPRVDRKTAPSTALLEAVSSDNKEAFNFLLPLSDPKADESRALCLAVANGNLKMFNALLPLSDPKARNSEAIETAIRRGLDLRERHPLGAWEFANILLPLSGSLSKTSQALISLGAAGETKMVAALLPLCDPIDHVGPALAAAAKNGRVETGLLLIEGLSKVDPARAVEAAMARQIAHMAAVEGGAIELVGALEGGGYSTPGASLIRALECASWRLAETLVEKAKGSLTAQEAQAALVHAAEFGPRSLVEALLPLADAKADNSAPLRAAVKMDRLDVVRALLPVSDARALESEALRVAAGKASLEMIEELLPHSDPGAKNSECLRSLTSQAVDLQWTQSCRRLASERGLYPAPTPERQAELDREKTHADQTLEFVKRFISISNPKDCESEALLIAVSRANIELARLLEPFSDPSAGDSAALRAAVKFSPDAGQELVALLIARSDANANQCEALKSALKAGELEILELVIPFTDPSEAERLIKKEGFEDDAEAMLLGLINPSAPRMKKSQGPTFSSPFRS